jgi:hypothetical protein
VKIGTVFLDALGRVKGVIHPMEDNNDDTVLLASVTPRVRHLRDIIGPLAHEVNRLVEDCINVDTMLVEAKRYSTTNVTTRIGNENYTVPLTAQEQAAMRDRYIQGRLKVTHERLAKVEQMFMELKGKV